MYWKPNQKLENGKYIIENVIGSGGFGITYKAKETASGKLIAIKTLNAKQHQKPDFDKRQQDFINEAMCLARFFHPHILQVERVFKEGDIWAVVMEYIDGENLHDYIFEIKGILSQQEAVKIIRQMGDALTYVHQRNFLHRDVKPLNILLRRTTLDAVLIDFGLAREFTEGIEKTHTNDLTQGFAPIEQYERRAERGSFTDVYALAATYYVMRTGKVPFPANFRKDAKIPLVPPKEYNSQISDKENQAILKGMELLPKDRPQTVGAWLELLMGETDQKTKRVMLKGAGREKDGGLKADQLWRVWPTSRGMRFVGSWVIWVVFFCFSLFLLWGGGVFIVAIFRDTWNQSFSRWLVWVMLAVFYFSIAAFLGLACVVGLKDLLKGKDFW
jgi:eukaryotic-like serine/threonine-protein kinase